MRPSYYVGSSPARVNSMPNSHLYQRVLADSRPKRLRQMISLLMMFVGWYGGVGWIFTLIGLEYPMPWSGALSGNQLVGLSALTCALFGYLVVMEYLSACAAYPTPIVKRATFLRAQRVYAVLLALALSGFAYMATRNRGYLALYLFSVPFSLLLLTINIRSVLRCLAHWLWYRDTERQYDHMASMPIYARWAVTLLLLAVAHLLLADHAVQQMTGLPPVFVIIMAFGVLLVSCTPLVAILAPKGGAFRDAQRISQIETQNLPRPLEVSDDDSPPTVKVGNVKEDNYPVCPELSSFYEHCLAEGATGSRKSSICVNPFIEHFVMTRTHFVAAIDNKGTSNEMFASLVVLADPNMTIKVWTPDLNKPTHVYNVFAQPFFQRMLPSTKADFFCQVLGTESDGVGDDRFYSEMSFRMLEQAFRDRDDHRNLLDLANHLRQLAGNYGGNPATSILKKTGQHPEAALRRLSSIPSLNEANTIDLEWLLRSPNLLYIHAPGVRYGYTAGLMARLFQWSIIHAAQSAGPDQQRMLFHDEFQTAASHNVARLFQQARSSKVGIVAAYQSRKDLIRPGVDLASVLENNCRVRWWFTCSDADNMQRLMRLGGEDVDLARSRSWTLGLDGMGRWTSSQSSSLSERVVPRLSPNEIIMASNDSLSSIFQMTRGDNSCDFHGFPVIIRSAYHIGKDEYERRCRMPFPVFPDSRIFDKPFDGGAAVPAQPGPRPLPAPEEIEVVKPPKSLRPPRTK